MMGDMADDYDYLLMREELGPIPWPTAGDGSKKQTARWKTANGEKVRICDMTDDHLFNTILFLEKRAKQMVRKFLTMNPPHGDVATVLFDSMVEELSEPDAWMDEVPPIYWKMKEDAKRRGMRL
jgi:hypothetical protein